MKIRHATDRGKSQRGWLNAKHSFSFGDYRDEDWMEFGKLRVLNEDHIAAGSGFPMHPHKNMEIITVMLSGEMRHRDSMGHEESLLSGEVQAMTAGSGIMHSEWNPSDLDAHLFQLWIKPEADDLEPSYDQFKPDDNKTQVLASKDGCGLKINAKAEVTRQKLESGESWAPNSKTQNYVHIITGEVEVANESLSQGDAIAFDKENGSLTSKADSELLIINMY